MNILLLSSFIFFTSASNFLEEWWMIINHLKPTITWLMPSYVTKMLELLGFVYFFSKRSIKDQFYILFTTPRFCHYKSILKNQIHFKVPSLHGKTFRATHMESMLVVSLQPIENLCNVDIFQPRGTNARLQHILKLAYYSLFSSLFLAEKSWIWVKQHN